MNMMQSTVKGQHNSSFAIQINSWILLAFVRKSLTCMLCLNCKNTLQPFLSFWFSESTLQM